jgi:SAM-dependent methyltransferase
MDGYDIRSYGNGFAEVYDRWYATMGDLDGCVDRLARLAGPHDVVELGVGTGRVAIPLSRRVGRYTGVDASPEMLDRLRSKAGSERIDLVEGDMADVPITRPRPDRPAVGLVFFSYNTFFNLASIDRQRRCLSRGADLLADGGYLVIEAFVPGDEPSGPQGMVVPTRMTVDTVVLTATIRDPAMQTVTGQHIEFVGDQPRLHPWLIRYCTPAQLDEMARVAGLDLVERRSGWRDEPFDAGGDHHVSVYRRPAPDSVETVDAREGAERQ